MDNHNHLIQDNHGRRVNYLRISVTDRCNFRCLYCVPPEGVSLLPREEILSYEEIMQVVKAAVGLGITRFRVTGGEPLSRPGIIGFLETLVKTPGVEYVSLTTNGSFLLCYHQQLNAIGLGGINVSLNSLKRQGFAELSGVDGFNRVWDGINALIGNGFNNIKLNTVIMRGYNDGEIMDFVRLTVDRPLTVRFIEHMPCGVWQNDSYDSTVPSGEIMETIRTSGHLAPSPKSIGYGPARYYRFEDAQGLVGFISPVSEPFCASCNRLRLTADGRLKACLLSNDIVDVKSILMANSPLAIHAYSGDACPRPLRRSGDEARRGQRNSQLPDAFIRAAMLKPAVHHNEELVVMSRIGG
ncbi:MAG: GTP 3',8-cyclase MoaA [Planctomycetota bacterium]